MNMVATNLLLSGEELSADAMENLMGPGEKLFAPPVVTAIVVAGDPEPEEPTEADRAAEKAASSAALKFFATISLVSESTAQSNPGKPVSVKSGGITIETIVSVPGLTPYGMQYRTV